MKVINRATGLGFAIALLASGAMAQSLKDAQEAINEEQYAKAKGILSTLVKNQANKGENYFYLGKAYLLSENPDSAQVIFEQGIAADPKINLNTVGLGAALLAKGDSTGAASKFNEVESKIKKKDYLELLYIGRAYLDEGKYDKALGYLTKAKESNPKKVDPYVYLALGDAYLGLSDLNNAYMNYQEAYSLDEGLLIARVKMATISRRSQAYDVVIPDLTTITQEHPDFAPAYRELAETYYQNAIYNDRNRIKEPSYQELMKKGVEAYKGYMDRTDYSLDSRMRYADFLILSKDYTAVEEQAAEMAKIDKVNPRILRYLGYANYEQGHYTEGIGNLNSFISKVDTSRIIAQDYYILGLSKIKADTVNVDTTAFADLKLALAKEPTLAYDLEEIAKGYYGRKYYKLSAPLYYVAGQTKDFRDEVLADFYAGLSYMFYYQTLPDGDPEKEVELLHKADKAFDVVNKESEEGSNVIAYFFRARVNGLIDMAKNGDDTENQEGLSVPHYEKFAELTEKQNEGKELDAATKAQLVEAYGYIGYKYLNTDQEKAKKIFTRLLELDPEDEFANYAIKALANKDN
ncbi:tetratricopeptide repeat protein [Olivibacter sitiensis]|uniref:tetratricopeptide repeat protein n=1 Tax=Olivibacter sitiensis TaxID=376470 RepID=UPI0004175AC7|nr:tetratricopeptide repeat protein [Olivibacter sitiensis]